MCRQPECGCPLPAPGLRVSQRPRPGPGLQYYPVSAVRPTRTVTDRRDQLSPVTRMIIIMMGRWLRPRPPALPLVALSRSPPPGPGPPPRLPVPPPLAVSPSFTDRVDSASSNPGPGARPPTDSESDRLVCSHHGRHSLSQSRLDDASDSVSH